jgi:hypothetical protein
MILVDSPCDTVGEITFVLCKFEYIHLYYQDY